LTDLQVSIESADGLERRIRVQVPAARIEEEVETRLRATSRSARLKGFRPGKVPDKVVRQRFGGQIREEVLQEMLQASYSEAVTREKLRPAGSPSIQPEAVAEGQDFAYVATFEIYPDFQVQGLEALAVRRPDTGVSDADVDSTVEKLRAQRSTWRPVDRAAAQGDQVIVDFDGRREGQPMPGGQADKLPIVVGGGRMLPDFEAQLLRVRAGDEKDFTVRFPADYHEKELAGQEARFHLKVHEVQESVLPVVDAEFVKGFGIASGDVAELRREVRLNLERDVQAKIQAEVKRQVLEQLLAANPIALPGVLVSREASSLQAESMQSLGIRDAKDAPALANFQPVAERRVRLGLILASLIQEQKIEVDRERIRVRLDQVCQGYDRPDEVRRYYLENPSLMGQLENQVIEEQIIDWLIGKARIEAHAMPFSELMSL
jgi:trigger factor